MLGLIIALHVIICILLITIILIQAGRGGGLVEGFSGVESMFGPKTSTFLTRTTTILSILFFITCLILAFFSASQSRSLIRDTKAKEQPATVTPPPPTAQPEVQSHPQAKPPEAQPQNQPKK